MRGARDRSAPPRGLIAGPGRGGWGKGPPPTCSISSCSFCLTSSTVSVGSTCRKTVVFLRLTLMYMDCAGRGALESIPVAGLGRGAMERATHHLPAALGLQMAQAGSGLAVDRSAPRDRGAARAAASLQADARARLGKGAGVRG